jgi:hypothetical protein
MLKTAQNYQDYFQKSYYKYIHMKIFLTWNKIKKDIFRRIFSATIDGRNLIFGHKLHIGMPYCG